MKTFTMLLLATFISANALAGEIKISVKGMVCAFCAQGITKKFKAEPSVKSVDVSLEKKTVVLETNQNQDISDQKITKILTDAGYNIESIQRK